MLYRCVPTNSEPYTIIVTFAKPEFSTQPVLTLLFSLFLGFFFFRFRRVLVRSSSSARRVRMHPEHRLQTTSVFYACARGRGTIPSRLHSGVTVAKSQSRSLALPTARCLPIRKVFTHSELITPGPGCLLRVVVDMFETIF